MLRMLGIGLIVAGLGASGFVYAAYARQRLRALEDAQSAVSLLAAEISLMQRPLCQAIENLAQQNTLLSALAQEGCPTQGEALDRVLRRLGLDAGGRATLQRLFSAIPTLSAGQTAPFDLATQQLAAAQAMQKKALQQGASLYPKLGLLAAFTALLLLV